MRAPDESQPTTHIWLCNSTTSNTVSLTTNAMARELREHRGLDPHTRRPACMHATHTYAQVHQHACPKRCKNSTHLHVRLQEARLGAHGGSRGALTKPTAYRRTVQPRNRKSKAWTGTLTQHEQAVGRHHSRTGCCENINMLHAGACCLDGALQEGNYVGSKKSAGARQL